jgi:TRAP-type mannitol/chloroaromatic compound transport system permease small subunit
MPGPGPGHDAETGLSVLPALQSLAARIDTFTDVLGRVTAWSTFALVLVMAGNVLLRYAFSTGSVWAQELEWHLMAPICLFGMSYALRHGEHVRVDVVYGGFTPRTKRIVDVISAILAIMVSILVIKLSWTYVGQSWSIDEGSANPGGIPCRYVLKALIPIGFALLAVQSLAELARALVTLRSPR